LLLFLGQQKLPSQETGSCVGTYKGDPKKTCKMPQSGWQLCLEEECQAQEKAVECKTFSGTGDTKHWQVAEQLQLGECQDKTYGAKESDCITCEPTTPDSSTYYCAWYHYYLLKTPTGECTTQCSGTGFMRKTTSTACKGEVKKY